MRIALGSDHSGFDYKERLKLFLIESGHGLDDFGTDGTRPVDYPTVVRPLAEAVAAGEFDRGIVLGDNGHGLAVVANRVPGVRCAVGWDLDAVESSRRELDANVLALHQRRLDFAEVVGLVECWLEAAFDGGRHARRVRKIDRPRGSFRSGNGDARFPQRAEFVDAAVVICDSCRQEFRIPVDIFGGSAQEIVEECPVCCHENVIFVRIDRHGAVSVSGDPHITG